MKFGRLVLGLAAAFLVGRLQAESTGAEFLKFGVGARSLAMGEAVTASADDISALYWNPAALTRLPKFSAILAHSSYVRDSYYDYAALGGKIPNVGAVGFGITNFNYGDIDTTDFANNSLQTLNPQDRSLALGYAFSLPPKAGRISLGASAKYVQQELLDTAQTMTFDLGALTPAYGKPKARFGLAAQNLGGELKFDNAGEALPTTYRLGGSFCPWPRIEISADAVNGRGEDAFFAFGGEYGIPIQPYGTTFLRAGYNTRNQANVSGQSGLSLGLGFQARSVQVDYAFRMEGNDWASHHISLGYRVVPVDRLGDRAYQERLQNKNNERRAREAAKAAERQADNNWREGKSLLAKGDILGASNMQNRALESYPAHTGARVELIHIQKRLDSSIKKDKFETDNDRRAAKGIYLYNQGDWETASSVLGQLDMSSLSPELVSANVVEYAAEAKDKWEGQVWQRKRSELLKDAQSDIGATRLDLAERKLKGILAKDPNDGEARSLLATVSVMSQTAGQSAKEELREKLVPELLALGAMLRAQRKYTDALEKFAQVLPLEPTNVVARTNIKEIKAILLSQGEFVPPIVIDDKTEAKYKEGLRLYGSERYEEAKAVFQEVLRLDPKHKEAQNALKVLQDREK